MGTLSPEDIQQIVHAIEQLGWVESIKEFLIEREGTNASMEEGEAGLADAESVETLRRMPADAAAKGVSGSAGGEHDGHVRPPIGTLARGQTGYSKREAELAAGMRSVETYARRQAVESRGFSDINQDRVRAAVAYCERHPGSTFDAALRATG